MAAFACDSIRFHTEWGELYYSNWWRDKHAAPILTIATPLDALTADIQTVLKYKEMNTSDLYI